MIANLDSIGGSPGQGNGENEKETKVKRLHAWNSCLVALAVVSRTENLKERKKESANWS